MRYPHTLAAFASQPWAMQPEKLLAIAEFLAFKADGGMLSAEEVEARISNKRAADVQASAGDVLVVPVVGVISQRMDMMTDVSGGVSTDRIDAILRQAGADDTIKSIVLDFDSPGGGVYGVQALAATIREVRAAKPVVAQVNSLAASGAYWLASQTDEIVVAPGGEGGSIGVYVMHEDLSKRLAEAGVSPTLVKAGQNKAETHAYFPLSTDAREAIQVRVDQTYDIFVREVAAGRGVTLSAVKDRFGQGRVFGAEDMIARGMADRVGTLRETLDRLGAAPAPRMRAATAARHAFAAGDQPALSVIEEHLRDAGFPKALATEFVSRGKGAFRQGDPGETRQGDPGEGTNQAAADALRAMSARLDGLSLPTT